MIGIQHVWSRVLYRIHPKTGRLENVHFAFDFDPINKISLQKQPLLHDVCSITVAYIQHYIQLALLRKGLARDTKEEIFDKNQEKRKYDAK